jgi:hypothetical protein
MPNEWFIQTDSQIRGPFSDQQVKKLAALGQITPVTPIRLGEGTWATASSVKGLFLSVSPRPQQQVDDHSVNDSADSLRRDGE